MVGDQIRSIICSNLTDYLKEDEINYAIDGNRCKYSFKIKDFLIEFVYDFIDEIYTVKLEYWKNNLLNNITQLTKCREFKKTVKKIIKINNLKYNSFPSHVFAIMFLVKKELDEKNSLIAFDQVFIANLKFDGISIR